MYQLACRQENNWIGSSLVDKKLNIEMIGMKNIIGSGPSPAVSYFHTKQDSVIT